MSQKRRCQSLGNPAAKSPEFCLMVPCSMFWWLPAWQNTCALLCSVAGSLSAGPLLPASISRARVSNRVCVRETTRHLSKAKVKPKASGCFREEEDVDTQRLPEEGGSRPGSQGTSSGLGSGVRGPVLAWGGGGGLGAAAAAAAMSPAGVSAFNVLHAQALSLKRRGWLP